MRTADEMAAALALADAGLNDCEVSRSLDIPRSTIREWRSGVVPARPPGPECRTCGHPEHPFDELPEAYCYLPGLYLGDGHIARHARGVFSLRIFLDSAYPGIVEECRQSMVGVLSNNRTSVQWNVQGDGVAIVRSYSKQWPCLFPQHGPGRKHERAIHLVEWQQRAVLSNPRPLLRGLIHSDGCRSINRVATQGRTYRYPRYFFTNASDDIRSIFCSACELIGVEWRQMNARTVSVARSASVASLDAFIGPKV